jgi:hypothetical protein
MAALATICRCYAIFCADAQLADADLSNWTDNNNRAALVPAFDDEI